MLGGCAAPEKLPEADTRTPAAFRAGEAAPALPRPATDWWRELASSELDRLQEIALANNRELQVAIARVAQAQAQLRIAEGARAPGVEAFARRELQAPREGPGSAQSRSDWHSETTYQLGLRASYEVDLWGRAGYAAQSALAAARASVHQRETVALTLTADVAATYLEYLSLNDRIAINERSLQNRRNSLLAVDKRLRQGDATALETAQQRVAVANAEATTASLAQRRERAFNRLALLTGLSPAELKLHAAGLNGLQVPSVGAGLPAELLCRRPDIRRAEAQLASAQLDVQSLRANLFPAFSLTGEIGYGSRTLAALVNPASLFVMAAGSVVQVLADGGRREGQIELARAKHLELLHQYSGTLLTAVREVEDALAATRLTEEQHRALLAAQQAAKSAYALSLKFYELGAVDYFQVLDAEQKMVTSEDATESALHDRMRAAVDLYRSLGGGTRAAQGDPCRK